MVSASGGTTLTPIKLPRLYAVLVNPGVRVSTGLVFQRSDSMGMCGTLEHNIPSNGNVEETIEALARARNDVEEPAIELVPQIRQVLVRLARMSGSGATCFGLVDDLEIAQNLA